MTGTEQAWSRGVENGQTEMLWEERQMENDRSELRCGRKSHGRRRRKGGGEAGDRVWIRSEKALGKGAFCGGVGSDHKTVKIAKITLVLQRKRPEKRIIIKTR